MLFGIFDIPSKGFFFEQELNSKMSNEIYIYLQHVLFCIIMNILSYFVVLF